ncbi:hypothetical protein [Halorubrum sp. DTA46]|uniref:hypothetical protein n=1 Tax=Halorubrum sp. DTA46 TaxID=3402162 RepID=UPI003AAD86E1
MASRLAIVGLVAVGVLLMANPLYLPVTIGEADVVYTHTVQPAGGGSPLADGHIVPDAPDADDGDTVAYESLDADARAAFDRARDASGGGFSVADPTERVDSLSYPAEPTRGDGLLIVEREGERYEFWTRSIEQESTAVIAQRAVVQPVAFLAGFLSVVAAVALGARGRLSSD